jgi:hypothetical protein
VENRKIVHRNFIASPLRADIAFLEVKRNGLLNRDTKVVVKGRLTRTRRKNPFFLRWDFKIGS